MWELLNKFIKSKTDAEVLNGFKKIYNQSKPKALRSDNGSEFINKKFKEFKKKMESNKFWAKQGNHNLMVWLREQMQP